ncbi:VOC family protein [Streptomyces sp. NBC_01431]|uniref:VOC family protein n=1 Tax=Streptomyces sp. NBC_01431 TaxID=2903863 RepID=UPI003FCD9A72
MRQPGRYAPDAGPSIRITALDHLVRTVADIERTIGSCERILGMYPVTFGEGPPRCSSAPARSTSAGSTTNFAHTPRAPPPGSADLCLLTDTPHDQILATLAAHGVTAEDGPVARTGAQGLITSRYLRDPDGNLVEISTYDPRRATLAGAASGGAPMKWGPACRRLAA